MVESERYILISIEKSLLQAITFLKNDNKTAYIYVV